MTPAPVSVAVFVSGAGSNLQALLDGLAGSTLARIARVVASRSGIGAIDRARRAGIAVTVLADPDDAREVTAAAGDARLLVLAGYLKRVPAAAVARFRWRLVNIHPALLPAFGGPGMHGLRVHQAVLASGATLSGVTVHYVDEEFDRGPMIAQWPVPVRPGDTPESLAARVLAVEHRVLPLVVLELARRGVPDEPVRLHARRSTFVTGDQGEIELE